MRRARELPFLTVVGVLAVVRLVVNTAQRFVYPFLPAIARGLGISLERAGILVSARWLAGLATPVAVGWVGRGERRVRLAVVGLSLFAIGATLTALTSVYLGAIVGFALMGIAKPMYDIAAQSYVADRTPYHRRARYMSIIELTWAGGLLVGAPLAGWLIDRQGWASPFWLLAVLAAASIPVLLVVMDRDDSAGGAAGDAMRLDRSAVVLLVVTALFVMAAEIMFVVFGAWLEDVFGLSLVALGGAAIVVGLAELTGEGATILFTDRLGKRRSVVLGLAASMTGFGLLALEPTTLWIGMMLVALAFLGFEFTIVSAIPLATEAVPTARARYLGIFTVANSLGRTIGAAIGPAVFSRFGLFGNALVAAGADLLAIVLLLAWVHERPRDAGVDAESVK